VTTLISHSMTFSILSAHKFADVARNLMLMTLTTETGSFGSLVVIMFSQTFSRG
jgi:hypothetical protein